MHHIVVTTINPPLPAILALAEGALQHDWKFLVIGDSKSPADFHVDGAEFWSVEQQIASGFRFAELVPTRHYARKNVGYLAAMRNKASTIIETDDDNLPLPAFWAKREATVTSHPINTSGWVNVYGAFSNKLIWPRGLPLDEVAGAGHGFREEQATQIFCPIQQGLADDNPDVDAIYRLLLPLPLKFDQADPVALVGRASCPFNSQNTTWFPEAYPLTYLPFHCSFRMTDIWRSFVSQRIALAKGWGVLFHNATMYQVRNEHDLMRDFSDEVIGYLNNRKIMDGLLNLPLSRDPGNMLDELVRCYDLLIEMEVVGTEERALLSAWCSDVSSFA